MAITPDIETGQLLSYVPDTTPASPRLITDDEHVACPARTMESISNAVCLCWRYSTGLLDRAIDGFENKVENKFGRKISSEDVISVMLVMMSILEASLSSRVWISARTELVVSAIISIITLMNDRTNYNNKFAQLKKLQLEYIRVLQGASKFIEQVEINQRPSGRMRTLSVNDCNSYLENYWNICSEMRVRFQDGTFVRLQNLSNTKNHYAQFNNLAIAISWLIAFLNVAFDLVEVAMPTERSGSGHFVDSTGNFSANATIGLDNIFAPMALQGNYSMAGACNSNGTFSGDMLLDPYVLGVMYRRADRAATVLGGVPYRSIANWITTCLVPQQLNIRNSAKQLSALFKHELRSAIGTKREAVKIPRELLLALNRTGQSSLALRMGELRTIVAIHNRKTLEEQGRQQGRQEIQGAATQLVFEAKGILEKAKSQRYLDLATAHNALTENIRALARSQAGVMEKAPDVAALLQEQKEELISAARTLKEKERTVRDESEDDTLIQQAAATLAVDPLIFSSGGSSPRVSPRLSQLSKVSPRASEVGVVDNVVLPASTGARDTSPNNASQTHDSQRSSSPRAGV